jgi:hypothetical protein
MNLLRGFEMTVAYLAHTAFRFVQMIFALAVCGLYGADLHDAAKHHVPSDSKWVRVDPVPLYS